MRNFSSILFAACLLASLSCKKSVVTEEATKDGNRDFTIPKSTCAHPVYGNDLLEICYDELVTDSRCPVNAACIWEGVAVAKFSFVENGSVHQLALGTRLVPGICSKDTAIGGYRIELVNINPYPAINQPPTIPDERTAEISVTKL